VHHTIIAAAAAASLFAASCDTGTDPVGLDLAATGELQSAGAAYAATTQFRGMGGYLNTYVHDSCSNSGVYFEANANTTHNSGSGAPTTSDRGYVHWYDYNWCTADWSAGYAEGDVDLGGPWDRLRASGQLTGWDYHAGAVAVTVDVALDADPDTVSSERTAYRYATPFGFSQTRTSGSSASASASGAITVGGRALDVSTASGTVYSATDGVLSVYHP